MTNVPVISPDGRTPAYSVKLNTPDTSPFCERIDAPLTPHCHYPACPGNPCHIQWPGFWGRAIAKVLFTRINARTPHPGLLPQGEKERRPTAYAIALGFGGVGCPVKPGNDNEGGDALHSVHKTLQCRPRAEALHPYPAYAP